MHTTVRVLVSLFFFSLLIVSCTKDNLGEPEAEENQEVDGEIWTGPALNFAKAANANPGAEENQDRITENVWITRGNSGGQIYNAKSENNFVKEVSPKGTRWAVGTLDQINQLQFRPFRAAVDKPKNVVGKNLVLHLVEDNVYLSVKFTSWSDNKGGGFSYERSTK